MKITNGWISNSSSSSFIIKIKGSLDQEKAKELLKETYGSRIGEEALERNSAKLADISIPLERYEYHKESSLDYNERDAVKKAKNEGYNLYRISLSDHTGDETCIINATQEELDNYKYDYNDYLEDKWRHMYYDLDFILVYRNDH